MRHKYTTEAIVLERLPHREAGMMTVLLTKDFGLVYAKAEGVRRSGAKLAHALQTWSHTSVLLVRGKEGWRVTGASLLDNPFKSLDVGARRRMARISGLLQRLYGKEIPDERIYSDMQSCLKRFAECEGESQDSLETLMVLRLLSHLGIDSGGVLPQAFDEPALTHTRASRKEFVERINRGITVSGL